MQDLTLVIPAKYESESLPIFLNEIANLDCKKLIVLESEDTKTIKSLYLYAQAVFTARNARCINSFCAARSLVVFRWKPARVPA